VAGLVLAAVAAGAGWYGYGKATATTVAFESFDLSNDNVPPSNHVAMTGVVHTEYVVELQTKRGESTSIDHYVPITATNWRPGDPLVYFFKTKATAYTPPEGGKSFEFSPRTPPFRMTTQPSALIENGLPGPVAEVYRKDNVALAPAPVVVDHPSAEATHAGRQPLVLSAQLLSRQQPGQGHADDRQRRHRTPADHDPGL
jgi:hypothetical protein